MTEYGNAQRIQLLDHGYVQLTSRWGSDETIVEAARMSTNKGFLGWEPEVEYKCSRCNYTLITHRPVNEHHKCPNIGCSNNDMTYRLVHHGDERLLRYLYTHDHTTPFEMAGATFEVQLPIFVTRQWHRHRTQSYNELSGRYTELLDVFYVPTVERLMMEGGANKQAQSVGDVKVHPLAAEDFRRLLTSKCQEAYTAYELSLNMGITKELARAMLPVNFYTRMRASANLLNWLRFLSKRLPEDAQWETRQYAQIVHAQLSQLFPHTLALFDEKMRKSVA